MKRDGRTIENVEINLVRDFVDLGEALTIVAKHFENMTNDPWSEIFSCDDPIHDGDGWYGPVHSRIDPGRDHSQRVIRIAIKQGSLVNAIDCEESHTSRGGGLQHRRGWVANRQDRCINGAVPKGIRGLTERQILWVHVIVSQPIDYQ